MTEVQRPRLPRRRGAGILPWLAAVLAVLAGPLPPSSAVVAQEVPRDEYLRFLPVDPHRIVSRTPASERLDLYGDRSHPEYLDRRPRDGIDDRRHDRLMELAVRFSPYMIRNTGAVPLHLQKFMQPDSAFPLRVDRWDVARPQPELVGRRRISLGETEGEADDEALEELLLRYHPERPEHPGFRNAVTPAESHLVEVLFLDFPGGSLSEWQDEYENALSGRLAGRYEDARGIYCHPFLRRVPGADGRERIEFVLQYWFFYPFNDGGNNHEGDWEHINVVLAVAGERTTHLDTREVQALLGPPGSDALPADSLRLGRVEYYFHGQVMKLDLLDPNVYAPREAWQRQIADRDEEKVGGRWILERIREMAYLDDAETRINTHPVVYIGGDNKGLDQLLGMPGARNRDSHGNYPFPGLYKDVGPAGAAEQIGAPANLHRSLSRQPPPATLERFDRPGRIRILPDWERVADLALEEPEVRRAWAWLILPIRWGYPAVESRFAGIVKHAETGNLSPLGPAYNTGWNRTGATLGYRLYDPHRFGGTLPLGWQDGFINSWGFLNLTLPTLVILPPFDFVWRVLASPARAPLQANQPTFFPRDSPPFRLVGAGADLSLVSLPEKLTLLFTAPDFFGQIEAITGDGAAGGFMIERHTELALAPQVRFESHIGKHLVSENVLRRVSGQVGIDIRPADAPSAVPVRANLELWEYVGSLRYNLSTGAVQPFVRAGYGLSWYRLTDATLGGQPMEPDRTEWIRQPSLFPPENLLPNTWHAGFGVEVVPVRSFAPFPRGLDVGIRASWSVFAHGLGLRRPELLSEQESVTVGRGHFNLGVSLTY